MKKNVLLLMTFLGMFLFSSAQTIEVVGTGVKGFAEHNLTVTNPESVTKVIADAHFKHVTRAHSGPITLSNHEESESATFSPCDYVYNSYHKNWNSGYFTYTFTSAEASGFDKNALSNLHGLYSFSLYVFKDLTTPAQYSVHNADKVLFYRNGIDTSFVYNLPINTAPTERTITVTIPISELDKDSRKAIIDVTAGGVTAHREFNTYNKGESLNITPIVLENVGGDVTNVEVSIYSPVGATWKERGDSFITGGAVVTVDMGLNHCTFTKGFWGNKKGKDCNNDNTETILDGFDLANNPIEIGLPGHYLIIDNTQCVLDFLPGGGPSKILADDYDCINTPPVKKKGALKNGLLTQTIALALNLRYDADLGVLPLKQFVVTYDPEDQCDPFSDADGGEAQFEISAEIIAELGVDNTIADLFELASLALGDGYDGDLSLSEINDAVTAINEGFDECRVLGGFYDEEQSEKSAPAGSTTDVELATLAVYPNPTSDVCNIEFTSFVDGNTNIELYNIMGKRMDVLFDEATAKDKEYTVAFSSQSYPAGMYFVIVRNGTSIQKQKVSITK